MFFLVRAIAKFIDGMIVCLFIFGIVWIWTGKHPLASGVFDIAIVLSSLMFAVAYSTLCLERFGATPGKLLLGLRVVTTYGEPLTFNRALARSLAELLSSALFFGGYSMAVGDGRTLHDRICSTEVVGVEQGAGCNVIALVMSGLTVVCMLLGVKLIGGSGGGMVFSPDGQMLASVQEGQKIKLYYVKEGTLLRTLEGHKNTVANILFAPDSQTLVSNAYDGEVRLWRLSDGTLLYSWAGHQAGPGTMTFSLDGQVLAASANDSSIKLYQVGDGTLLQTLRGFTGVVANVAFAHQGDLLIAGALDSTIRTWRTSDSTLVYTLKSYRPLQTNMAVSPDGQLLAAGLQNNNVQVWQIDGGSPLRMLEIPRNLLAKFSSSAPVNLTFSPDGRLLVASETLGSPLWMWRVSDGALLQVLEQPTSVINMVTGISRRVSFTPDGQLLASGSGDYKIRLWRVSDGALLKTLEGHRANIRTIAFSPDSQLLASRSDDDTTILWQVSDGKLLYMLR